MANLSKLIDGYILHLRLRLVVFFQILIELVNPVEEEEFIPKALPTTSYISHEALSELLRESFVKDIPNMYSPDNSLLASHIYGKDIKQFQQIIEKLQNDFMLDRLVGHEEIMSRRGEVFLRSFFYADGAFMDPAKGIKELRSAAIRLVEGYELRRLHPNLGLNTHQNLVTTHQVLVDLTEFFVEVFNGKRNDSVSIARSDQ